MMTLYLWQCQYIKNIVGWGIGTALLKELLSTLKSQGYPKVSLSVQKANYAVKMYQAVGFHVVNENTEEYIMVAEL